MRIGTVIVRAAAVAGGKPARAVVRAEISSGDRSGCLSAGTTANDAKPSRNPVLHSRCLTARLGRAGTIGSVTTVEAAQLPRGSPASPDGSEGSIACRQDTVIGTLAAIGTMKCNPDLPAASTFTPGGGA